MYNVLNFNVFTGIFCKNNNKDKSNNLLRLLTQLALFCKKNKNAQQFYLTISMIIK